MKIIPLLLVLLPGSNRTQPFIGLTAQPANGDQHTKPPATIAAIDTPPGYARLHCATGSFGEWLRAVPLKTNKTVYLYNGHLKKDQSVQFAVLDMPVGTKDLQQCADAIMRLRAEFLFSKKRFSEIAFKDNNGKWYRWEGTNDRVAFERYLEKVFGWCGSASLEKQLHSVPDSITIQPGDVFITGGFPGHAMIVADVAINDKGKPVFLLAQSYMPAQDIHIVNNPASRPLSPWYEINEIIDTPEWSFLKRQLRRW